MLKYGGAGLGLGFVGPYLVALTNLIPGFGHETGYEVVLSVMIYGALGLGAGGLILARIHGPES